MLRARKMRWKNLKKKIEELKFVKGLQQYIITDMELITGVDMSNLSAGREKIITRNISRRDRKKESTEHLNMNMVYLQKAIF